MNEKECIKSLLERAKVKVGGVEMRKYITKEQAMYILPDGDSVHTLINVGIGLCGADWDRESILDKIQKSDILELAGESAKGMEHGLCAYNKDTVKLSDVLWYIALAAQILNTDLETVMQKNIDKLSARYPNGFSEERSIHRAKGDI